MIYIIILVAIILIFLLIGNYFYNFSLNPKKDKSKVLSNNESGDFIENDTEANNWFKENLKEVTMKSVTGANLVGYKITNKDSNLWAILIHGYTSKGEHMAIFAKHFYNMGFNVLVPDLLAHGKSEGKAITMGGIDSKDIIKWSDKISIEENDPKILLFGISMGAATVLNTLGKNPAKNVVAFIEDSGYVKVEEIFNHQLKKLYNVPKILVMPAAKLVTRIRGGYNLKSVDATKGIKTTDLPGLILHGEKDDFVPVENAYRVYELLNSEKEIHISKNAIHVEGATTDPEYWPRIENFINKYVKNQPN